MPDPKGDCSPSQAMIKMIQEAQRRRELLARFGANAGQTAQSLQRPVSQATPPPNGGA
jgi:excinuclease UvrABC helicase subunit UvrB